jgi:hypothetical protein
MFRKRLENRLLNPQMRRRSERLVPEQLAWFEFDGLSRFLSRFGCEP